jgi:hypothetical protein
MKLKIKNEECRMKKLEARGAGPLGAKVGFRIQVQGFRPASNCGARPVRLCQTLEFLKILAYGLTTRAERRALPFQHSGVHRYSPVFTRIHRNPPDLEKKYFTAKLEPTHVGCYELPGRVGRTVPGLSTRCELGQLALRGQALHPFPPISTRLHRFAPI